MSSTAIKSLNLSPRRIKMINETSWSCALLLMYYCIMKLQLYTRADETKIEIAKLYNQPLGAKATFGLLNQPTCDCEQELPKFESWRRWSFVSKCIFHSIHLFLSTLEHEMIIFMKNMLSLSHTIKIKHIIVCWK